MKTNPKILLVHLFSNGDCLYATTIAQQIKKDFPGCTLTWAVASFCTSILHNNPFVDHILEVKDITKHDTPAFRRLQKKFLAEKASGIYDEVFITHNSLGTNQAFYDGSTRSTIYRAYPHPITVPIQGVLKLTDNEKNKAEQFAIEKQLNNYQQVILFEYAPMSGQSLITKEMALAIAEGLVSTTGTAVILSSANKVQHANPAIVDGSSLSLRETAALTHYCTFLLGTSSGITWISTTTDAKQLPMVQLYHPGARFENPVSRDFTRFGLSTNGLIEIIEFEVPYIIECVKAALQNFEQAKTQYNRAIPLHFQTTRSIVYNLMVYLNIASIFKHIRVNIEVHGHQKNFYKSLFIGFIEFPYKLIKNLVTKK
ncbi:MAG: glycosyltransferase family 9 protein [Ferruginibacter sp.]